MPYKSFSLLLFIFFSSPLLAQKAFHVNNPAFKAGFSRLLKTAENHFEGVKGVPLLSNNGMTEQPDTIGYQLTFVPAGITDYRQISRNEDGSLDVHLKIGSYSTNKKEVEKRMLDLIKLIRSASGNSYVFLDDKSYGDTKIREVHACKKWPGGLSDATVEILFHRLRSEKKDLYNVSVNLIAHDMLVNQPVEQFRMDHPLFKNDLPAFLDAFTHDFSSLKSPLATDSSRGILSYTATRRLAGITGHYFAKHPDPVLAGHVVFVIKDSVAYLQENEQVFFEWLKEIKAALQSKYVYTLQFLGEGLILTVGKNEVSRMSKICRVKLVQRRNPDSGLFEVLLIVL
jgi:hypothetical protein